MSNNLNKAKKKSFLDEAVKFSLLSILLGLLVGAIVLMISGRSPIVVYGAMIEGIIGKPKYIAWTIIKATPYIPVSYTHLKNTRKNRICFNGGYSKA